MSDAVRGGTVALILLSIAVAVAFAVLGVFAPVQEMARAELGFSDFQMSLLQGIAASIPVAVMAVPLGRMVDRSNRVRLLIAMAVTWTAGTVLNALAGSFEMLFFARMLVGTGCLCALPVAISIAADYSVPERRGHAMLVLSMGKIVGQAAAFVLGGALVGAVAQGQVPELLADVSHWRTVLLWTAAGSAALILPLLLLREPQRMEQGEAAGAPFGAAMRAIWARRALLAPLFLAQITVVMADTSGLVWAAPVLTRSYGQSPEQFGGWMGGMMLFAGIAGTVLGGLAADWGSKGRLRGGMLGGAVLSAVISIPAAFYPLMPGVGSFGVMLGLLMTCGNVTGMVTATAIAVLVPNDIRGVCLGIFVVISSLIGLGIAPALVGMASDWMGGDAALRYALAAVGVIASMIAAWGFIVAMRSTPRVQAPA